MQNSFNQLDRLRQLIADLKSEVTATEAEGTPLNSRLRAVNTVIVNAPAEEQRARFHHVDLRKVRAAKSAAYSEREELQSKIQDIAHRVDSAKLRIAELQRDLQRAERLSVTDADLKTRQREVEAAIKSAGTRLGALRNKVNALSTKRREAQGALDAQTTAERELAVARQALEVQQGGAYIDGGKVDLIEHNARIAEAQKNLDEAKADAAGASAALPLLDGRIAEANEAINEETANSETLVETYFDIQLRKFELAYLTHARGIMDSLQSLVALGQITGNQLGNHLLAKMRQTLYVPADGKYPEAFDSAPWFGRSAIPDVSDVTARLTADLQAVKSI